MFVILMVGYFLYIDKFKEKLQFSEFLKMLENGEVRKIHIFNENYNYMLIEDYYGIVKRIDIFN